MSLSDSPFVLKHLRGVLSSALINSCLLHIILSLLFNFEMCIIVLVISKALLLRSCLTEGVDDVPVRSLEVVC